MGLSNFGEIATFIAAVNAGSFSEAAQQLGVTRSGVGKSIARLEERLNVRLINRTPRSLSLTDDGDAFFKRCVQLMGDLEAAELAMAERSGAPHGRLKISLPLALGHAHVLPVIDHFLAQWPNVSVEVSFTDLCVDLIEDGVDVALRIGAQLQDSDLISRTVAQQRMVLCASPSYLKKNAAPSSIHDLKNHQCLFYVSGGKFQPWSFYDDELEVEFTSASRLAMNSTEALRMSTLDGAGIGNLPSYLIEDDLRSGRLLALLPDYKRTRIPIRVLYPTRQHLSPKVRLFIDLLVAEWGDVPPWERDL
ncbi:LysR family transcriptional regulator [Duganella sp. FT80W]|uniref:LysR family transcriptional regulator n=1 Tax=Duganella guangzhouensis TaxID=2666084 RepID=A0A6I2L6R8_9BURK|nr:LysR family transcriptional regulator [Duganella guangzhouensis]